MSAETIIYLNIGKIKKKVFSVGTSLTRSMNLPISEIESLRIFFEIHPEIKEKILEKANSEGKSNRNIYNYSLYESGINFEKEFSDFPGDTPLSKKMIQMGIEFFENNLEDYNKFLEKEKTRLEIYLKSTSITASEIDEVLDTILELRPEIYKTREYLSKFKIVKILYYLCKIIPGLKLTYYRDY